MKEVSNRVHVQVQSRRPPEVFRSPGWPGGRLGFQVGVALLVGVVPTSLFSQENPLGEPTNDVPAVGIEFSVYAQERLRNIGFESTDGAYHEVTLYSGSRSDRFRVRGGVLRFTQGGAEDRRIAVAEVDATLLPPEGLIVFVPTGSTRRSEKASRRFDFHVVDDSVRQCPVGHLRVLNLSGFDLEGRLGDVSFGLAAGAVSPAAKVGAGLRVEIFARKGRTAFYEPDLSLEENERGLLILFPPFLSGSIEVQPRLLREALD